MTEGWFGWSGWSSRLLFFNISHSVDEHGGKEKMNYPSLAFFLVRTSPGSGWWLEDLGESDGLGKSL